jgi:glycosyltransferase involved in cell wall biosynthesis
MPNYPRGQLYPGYSGMLRREQMNGVDIIRTAIFPTQTARLLPRLANYFSFVLSSWLIGGWFLESVDYILTESPPLFLGIAGYLLSRWKRARWIFNISDLWPESAVRLGMISDGPALRLSKALEAFCYRKAWLITGQSLSILEDVKQRFPKTQTYHFSNGVDPHSFYPSARTQQTRRLLCEQQKQIVILYAGLHGHAQGLEQVLLAAQQVQDVPLLFIFLGDGPEKKDLIEMAKSLKLSNVRFMEPMDRDLMPALVASADICMIPLKIYLPGAVPSKLYEAMASARPVVLVAQGEAADIVSSSQAGLVVEPGDVRGIVSALRYLQNHPEQWDQMGTAGRRAVEMHFDRVKIVRRLAEFLSSHQKS